MLTICFAGSILVFLPGFEDMSMVNKVIVEELITKDNLKITIYMLHSMMQVIIYSLYFSINTFLSFLSYITFFFRHLINAESFNQPLKVTKKLY